jgi:hypothetical protein
VLLRTGLKRLAKRLVLEKQSLVLLPDVELISGPLNVS